MSKTSDDLLDRGFQLAYFIYPDRPIAIQVLRDAMSKLKVQRSREKKRTYWRDKHMTRKITRTVRDDHDALQWLIYCESTRYERQQEAAGLHSVRDLIVRYIKHLVQTTTAMSSFYVNVGMQRLLHNYNTSEAQRAYEFVTEHYPGSEEYRRIKGVLMKQLQARFSTALRTRRVNHGELRFEAFDVQEEWADCVNECLASFTPWSTNQTCVKVADLGPGPDSVSVRLFGHHRQGAHRDVIEASLCHMFIDPSCYGWLSERLGLDPPRARLALPRFYLDSATGDNGQSGGSPVKTSKLTNEERKGILDQLADETMQRQQSAATSLAIIVDHAECARIDDLDGGSTQLSEIHEGAKLIEIWTQTPRGRFLLATHWIDYTEWNGIAEAAAVVPLGNGRELLLELSPTPPGHENAGGAAISLTCRRTSLLDGWMRSLRDFKGFLRPYKLALAFVSVLALAGVIGAVKYRWESIQQRTNAAELRRQLVRQKSERASLQQRLDEKQYSASLASHRLTPEDLRMRNGEGLKETEISVPPGVSVVVLELPVSGKPTSYRASLKTFVANQEIVSESALRPELRNGNMVVALSVPSSLMEDRKHYVVVLYAANGAGRLEKVRFFTFHVVKP